MKPPKNRLKLLRVACGSCKAQQDSLNAVCSSCAKPMYANMSEEELSKVRQQVDAMEDVLDRIENGKTARKDPYADHDEAKRWQKALKLHVYLPGMEAYLVACRKVQLPFQILLMERTVRANLVFSIVLVAFAAIPFLFKWPFSVAGLMCLPAFVWIGITMKAYFNLRKAVAEVNA